MPGTYAIVAASGRGSRFGGLIPKQYRALGGRPVLRHALSALVGMDELAGIRVAIHPDDRELYQTAAAGLRLMQPVLGGATRQESVLAALESLEPEAPDRVLVHDGVRPLMTAELARRVLAALERADGALAGLPVFDTLKRITAERRIVDTVDRAGLWRAQTPQAFRYIPLLDAHRRFRGAGLGDDAAIAETAGLSVEVVPGAEENLKITTEEDLARAAALLASRQSDIRTGFGFDVHRFGPGDHVTLCGVAVPHDRGLVGHSDADVGLHALADAILGALGAGDIGRHFPSEDPRWRGADSGLFLQHAAALVRDRGGQLKHLDVTLICERPRIGPHRSAMIARVAALATLEPDRVSIKATTTDGLGFTGRGEGIAAQAVATVGLPA